MSEFHWSRRRFLTTVSAAGTLLLFDPINGWYAEIADPKIREIVARTIGIDTHNHVEMPLNLLELPGPKIDLAGEITKSGLSAICLTFAVDYQKIEKPGDAYNRFLAGMDGIDSALKDNKMKRALNLPDLIAAHETKKPIVIQSVEGGHFLEGKITRLKEAYDRGLRHLTLLHDNDAPVMSA